MSDYCSVCRDKEGGLIMLGEWIGLFILISLLVVMVYLIINSFIEIGKEEVEL